MRRGRSGNWIGTLVRMAALAAVIVAPAGRTVPGQEPPSIPEGMTIPRMTKAVKPAYYPDSLKARGLEGTVVLQAIVRTDGEVDPLTVRVVRSLHPVLDRSAIDALLESRFTPALFEGRPVRVIMQVPYTFRFRDTPAPKSGIVTVHSTTIPYSFRYSGAPELYAPGPVRVQLWKPPSSAGDGNDAFGTLDTLRATVRAPGAPEGTVIAARWTSLAADGERVDLESSVRVEDRTDPGATFEATNRAPWLAGEYALEIRVDRQIAARSVFRVAP